MSRLEAVGLTKRFGGLQALAGVDLHVDAGEVVGLLGPNGAGKTTLLDCLSGRQRPDSGAIRLAGVDVVDLPAHRRARLGLARTFQRAELFGTFSVRDHLLLAAEARRGRWPLAADLLGRSRPAAEDERRVDELLDLLGLTADADRPAYLLSLGRVRLVELGRALALRPVVVLADEPSSGLDDAERQVLIETVRALPAGGTSVLIIEHDLEVVAAVASRAYVLSRGRTVAEGPTAAVLRTAWSAATSGGTASGPTPQAT